MSGVVCSCVTCVMILYLSNLILVDLDCNDNDNNFFHTKKGTGLQPNVQLYYMILGSKRNNNEIKK